jgi:hypothetical protein
VVATVTADEADYVTRTKVLQICSSQPLLKNSRSRTAYLFDTAGQAIELRIERTREQHPNKTHNTLSQKHTHTHTQ